MLEKGAPCIQGGDGDGVGGGCWGGGGGGGGVGGGGVEDGYNEFDALHIAVCLLPVSSYPPPVAAEAQHILVTVAKGK